ncbi:MAG: N-formylglutamate amidohydrolase [Crocinitomicaceae bacterium]
METINPYYIKEARGTLAPIIISIPHSGTEIPSELKGHFREDQLSKLDDTDWFLDRLYDFAPDMGITVIHAKYSRWVIDLNRDPESLPLYGDGRLITGLTSTTDFLGNPIYNAGKEPNREEVERRLKIYYDPYFDKLKTLLQARKEQFGEALLWDAHSIRSKVPTIRPTKFPEMILGTADGKSADSRFVNSALNNLISRYEVNLNDPFKGGRITRHFGSPLNGIHALQLERNKDLYMDDAEIHYDERRASEMREVLEKTLTELIDLF